MRRFLMAIDAESSLASCAGQDFANIDLAMRALVRSATSIAADEIDGSGSVSFICEVQDTVSREVRRSTVHVIVADAQ